jgi:N-acetylmuramoyl-L-alanine amidase
MAKIFIGVGHGGKDPGAVANGLRESDLNLSIALACRDELERHGVMVLMSRTKDENDDISEEVRECNAYNPDLALDIHTNAGGGDGGEVYHSINGGKGKELAQHILNEISAIGQNSRGIKTRKNSSGTDYYAFIRSTKSPAVIVETSFIDNKKDIAIIDTSEEQKNMGIAIAKGVLKSLNIKYLGKAPTEEKPKKLYRVQVGAYSEKPNAEAMLKKLKADGYEGFIV